MKSKIRILAVDDHSMIRFALSEAVAQTTDLAVVGEARDGASAIVLHRKLRPDVVIMESRLPDMTGDEVTEQIRREFPNARVLIISASVAEENVWRALEAGASGYLSKSAALSETLEAIREVAAGNNYFPSSIARIIHLRKQRPSLTNREIQVLRKIVMGCSNKEIMTALNISEATVKLHLSNVFTKLEVSDRTQAAILAVRRGIVHLDER
jgi:DNA-binding NarL/FixJ family response regulator